MIDIDPTHPAAERAAVAAAWRAWLPGALAGQVRRDGHPEDGGFESQGWCDGRSAAFRVAQLIAARSWAGVPADGRNHELPCHFLRRDSPYFSASRHLIRHRFTRCSLKSARNTAAITCAANCCARQTCTH